MSINSLKQATGLESQEPIKKFSDIKKLNLSKEMERSLIDLAGKYDIDLTDREFEKRALIEEKFDLLKDYYGYLRRFNKGTHFHKLGFNHLEYQNREIERFYFFERELRMEKPKEHFFNVIEKKKLAKLIEFLKSIPEELRLDFVKIKNAEGISVMDMKVYSLAGGIFALRDVYESIAPQIEPLLPASSHSFDFINKINKPNCTAWWLFSNFTKKTLNEKNNKL